jgi:hypothetical protein
MSPKVRLIAAVTVGCFVIAFIVAFFTTIGRPSDKTWSSTDRRTFIASCVEKCRIAPGVTADRYPLCDSACACAADEGQKLMTGAELGAAAQAISSGTATTEQTAKMSSIQTAAMACVPADKKP